MNGPDIGEAASRLSRSIAQLADTTAGYIGTRLNQLDCAIQAEQRRWFWMLLGSGAMLLWLGAGSVFAGLAIVMAFWESGRVLASALVAGGFLLLAAVTGVLLRQCMHRPPSAANRFARVLALVLGSSP